MNLKSALAVFAFCAPAALYAAGCAAPAANGGGAAFTSQGMGGAAQSDARPAASPTEEKVRSPLPPPTGFVNDFAKVLSTEKKASLEASLARLKELEKIEVAVVTVETTGGQDINDYSLAVARGWGVGPPKGEGGGVLLLLAVKDRKWRIQVSRSLEADLPNDVTAVIGGRMLPLLRRVNYEAAVRTCVEGLVRRLAARRGFKADDILNAQN